MRGTALDRRLVARGASAAASRVENAGRSAPLGATVLPDGMNARSVIVLSSRVGVETTRSL